MYGIDIEEYTKLLEKQDFKCAICGSRGSDIKSLAVDHDHATGKVRGLLCDSCNLGIGKFKDSTELLTSAINYLKDKL
jgi:hypothetical protein